MRAWPRAGFQAEWGAFHWSEVPFVFAPFANCSRTAEGTALSLAWGRMLDSLLLHGSPGCMPSVGNRGDSRDRNDNSTSCVSWPKFDAAGETLVLGNW